MLLCESLRMKNCLLCIEVFSSSIFCRCPVVLSKICLSFVYICLESCSVAMQDSISSSFIGTKLKAGDFLLKQKAALLLDMRCCLAMV